MKFLSLVAVGILLTIAPCCADAQSGLFRHAFSCPERGPSSVCIFGTIPGGKQVTVLSRDWKSSAVPKEEFPNTDFDNGFKTITRLQVAAPPPRDADMIAVLAAAETVSPIPLIEVQDGALVARIGLYIKSAKELKLDPDIQLIKTRLLRLSPTTLLSETYLDPPSQAAAVAKELSAGCGHCENVPMLVGETLTDLFADIRSASANVESTCGGIKFAFALTGRPYLVSYAESCESDSFSATLIHDVSGNRPKRIKF